MVTEKELNIEETTIETEQVNNEAVEETAAEEFANQEETEVELLKKENEELKGKLEEAENRILRLQADFENSRRRARLDLEATEKYRAQSLITGLLPAIDNFERALN